MANIRRLAQDMGKPYLIFSIGTASKVAPDVCSIPDSSKLPQMMNLPASWDDGPYIYTPLDAKEQTIRLLTLHPGERDDPIICSLKTADFQAGNSPSYNALSYQWGDPSPTKFINILEGGVIEVRMNLHDALVQLRSKYEDKVFWIDSVCINQTDLSEKSHQIMLMGKIYSRATNVITWLGKASDDSGIAMDYLGLYEALMGYPDPDTEIPAPSQEVARCGPRGYIFCGEKWVYWECIDWFRIEQERGRQATLGGQMGRNAVNEETYRILAASKFRELVRDGAAYPTLVELLRLARQRDATYDVDKVFGILGLAGEHIQSMIVPDYNKPLRQVLMEATQVAVDEMGKHNVMSLLCDAGHTDDNLPSWCPNWTKPTLLTSLRYDGYNASKGWRSELKITGDILELPCIVADRIFDVSEEIFDGENWLALDEMELVAENVVVSMVRGQDHPIPVREQTEEQSMVRKLGLLLSPNFTQSFWRTLCADIDTDGRRPAPDMYGESLALFRRKISEEELKPSDPMYETFSSLLRQAFSALKGRRFFVIEKRFMGIGPRALKKGDYICIILGSNLPFVVRQEGDFCKLIGPAYVDAIMDGQVLRNPDQVQAQRIQFK